MTITYTDRTGRRRFLSQRGDKPEGVVKWHKELGPSTVTKWTDLETGALLQIPDDAWNFYGIEVFKEVLDEE